MKKRSAAPGLRTEPSSTDMEPQGNTPNDSYQDQCMCRTGCLFGDVRLTLSTGTPSDQHHEHSNFQWDIMPPDPMSIGTVVPTCFYGFLQMPPQVFHPPYVGMPYHYDGLETRPPDGPNEPSLPGYGGNFDPDVAVGGVGWAGRDFQRCGTSPGNPIHLITNTSRAPSYVSRPHLVQEVCRCSAWKRRWY